MKGSLNIASIKQKVEDNLHAVEQILQNLREQSEYMGVKVPWQVNFTSASDYDVPERNMTCIDSPYKIQVK